MKTLEHLKELAYRSHSGTSFSPERRAETVVNDYSAEVDLDIASIRKQGASDEQVARYLAGYTDKLKAYLQSHSNVMSSMITGPANFPVARNQKRSNWADNHYNHFREWRKKVLSAYDRYEKKAKIAEGGGELGVARKKLESLQANRELEKEANKKIKQALKDMVNIDEYLLGLGVQPHMIEHTMKWGFGSCNTNANIRNTKKRIEELEVKEAKAGNENKEVVFDGGKVILNYEIDRVQIQHDAKPEPAVITSLKSSGFKWSPFYKVWQRQLTRNAIWVTENLLKIKL